MDGKARRTNSHEIETRSVDNIRSLINATGRGLFRDVTGRDYGIDGIVELFDMGRITGKLALIQCKGQDSIIEPLKRFPEYVSCKGISAANLDYIEQHNIPVILTYASANDRDVFYFANLQSVVTKKQKEDVDNGQEKITVRIPVVNNSIDNMDTFWNIIEAFYCCKKLKKESTQD